MPCFVDEPSVWAVITKNYLCQACKLLSYDQMIKITDGTGHSLLGWYRDHLLEDFRENYEREDERKIAISEANRLGWNLIRNENKFCYYEDGYSFGIPPKSANCT